MQYVNGSPLPLLLLLLPPREQIYLSFASPVKLSESQKQQQQQQRRQQLSDVDCVTITVISRPNTNSWVSSVFIITVKLRVLLLDSQSLARRVQQLEVDVGHFGLRFGPGFVKCYCHVIVVAIVGCWKIWSQLDRELQKSAQVAACF